MSRLRMAAVAATLSCGLMLVGGTGIASAQDSPARLTQVVPVTGTKNFKGTYTIERFVKRGNKVYSVGTIKGKVGNKRVTKENVRMPATVGNGSAGAARASQVPLPLPPLPPGNACSILSLDLGPINLNLLGARRPHEPDPAADRRRPGRRQPARQPAVRDHRHPQPEPRQHAAGPARADPERAARALAANRLSGGTATAAGDCPPPVSERAARTASPGLSSAPASGRSLAGGLLCGPARLPRRPRSRSASRAWRSLTTSWRGTATAPGRAP